jgi:hypothetical protein
MEAYVSADVLRPLEKLRSATNATLPSKEGPYRWKSRADATADGNPRFPVAAKKP